VTDLVPPLVVKRPGPLVRVASRIADGVRAVSEQVDPYTRWWCEQNQNDIDRDGPMWVVIGDSTALGIGASAPGRSYVGVFRRRLDEARASRDHPRWRVVNLAMSGARVSDAIDRQLPILDDLPGADLVTCLIGTNDLLWSTGRGLSDRLRVVAELLPDGAVVGTVAGASPRALSANRALRRAAAERGLTVFDPWREPGPARRLAADRIHPNDIGYRLMARALARRVTTDPAQAGLGPPLPFGR
jgi:lysophospholipase L1-like esterase